MGTNYYLYKAKKCDHCGHEEVVEKHIGKSSAGWKFGFSANTAPNIVEMTKLLFSSEYVIKDEYGGPVAAEYLLEKIFAKQLQEPALWQMTYEKQRGEKHPEAYEYLDDWGFRFIKGEFS